MEKSSERGRSLVLTLSQTTLIVADAHDDTRMMSNNSPQHGIGFFPHSRLNPTRVRVGGNPKGRWMGEGEGGRQEQSES
jgi:hypothetical protein